MIKVLAIGKIKESALEALIADYQQRIEPYSKIIVESLKDEPTSDDVALNQLAIDKESHMILSKIKQDDYVILLELKGKLIDSDSLANVIQNAYNLSSKNVVFVIGGSMGVNDSLRQRAHVLWKLSANTFPHQIVRLLVLEQIYRSFRILNNHPYHK